MSSFLVETSSRTCLVNITDKVQAAVTESRVKSGICFIFVPHTTAAVTINESYDPDVAGDIENALSRLVPAGSHYNHSEGNADAHIKASMIGATAQIPVELGRLVLGRWQGVLFCEFDGPRRRHVQVKVLSSSR